MTARSSTNHANTFAKILAYIIGGILCLLPFHALLTTWVGSNFGSFDLWRIWKELLIAVLSVPTLFLASRAPQLWTWLKRAWLPRLILIYTLLHLLLGVIALQNKSVNVAALTYGLLANLRFLGFFMICAVVAAQAPVLTRYWWRIILVPAAIVVGFGLLQLALPMDFLTHFGYGSGTIPAVHTVDEKAGYQRLQSTLRGPNPLGAYLVLVASALLLMARRRGQQLIALSATMVVLFFSYSRSAWLGVLVSGFCLLLYRYRSVVRAQARRVSMVSAAVVVVLLGSLFVLRDVNFFQNAIFHSDETSHSAKSSNTGRAHALRQGLEDVATEPFGRGPGTAGPASTRNRHKARIAENYFLQIGQEVGWLGLGLFIAINILVGQSLCRLRADRRAQVLLASLIGLSIVNLVSHAWADDTLGLLWWGLAGIALTPDILKANRKRS